MSGDPDAVVVGSGPNGLVAAVRLAEAGQQVLVLEAASQVGGGTRTEELTLPGFRHDVCSSVHPLALASPAFRALGLEREGLAFAHPDIPLGHPVDETDGGPAAPRGRGDRGRPRAATVRPGVDWSAGSRASGSRSWTRCSRRWTCRRRRRSSSRPTAPSAPGPRTTSGGPPSVSSQPERCFAGLAAHAELKLTSLTTAGFGLLLGSLAHQVGWPVAVGGSQSIADALVARLRSLGGEVVTDHRVTSLADAAHPPAASSSTSRRGRCSRSAVTSSPPATSVASPGSATDLGCSRSTGPWTVRSPGATAGLRPPGPCTSCGTAAEVAASERAATSGAHAERPYVLFVQATAADPTRAPAGKHTGWAYCHVPHGSRVDMTDRIEAQLERFAPGFRDRVLARHTMDTAALEAHNANEIGGDIAGGSSDWRQFIARPVLTRSPWVTPVPGLYLCSSSTPPGGGVHGMGGWHAAREVLARA